MPLIVAGWSSKPGLQVSQTSVTLRPNLRLEPRLALPVGCSVVLSQERVGHY